MSSHVEITLPSPVTDKGAQVVLDGQDITSSLTGIEMSARVGELNRLTLELHLPTLRVDGVMRVEVPAATRETLVALGWTPPAAGSGVTA